MRASGWGIHVSTTHAYYRPLTFDPFADVTVRRHGEPGTGVSFLVTFQEAAANAPTPTLTLNCTRLNATNPRCDVTTRTTESRTQVLHPLPSDFLAAPVLYNAHVADALFGTAYATTLGE